MSYQRIFISTAIPYVNAQPHIGHALEFVQADAYARYQRLKRKEVYFLTGADENSLKNVRAAQELGVVTQKFVDTNAEKFRALKEILNISYDDFIRTTEPRHMKGAQKFWRACEKDIYKKTYRGLYCVGCELFYNPSELEDGCCPEHKTAPEEIEEENYFFRLSRYQEKLEKIFAQKHITIIPEHRAREVVSFIRRGLEDFSISRSITRAHHWGISVPGDQNHIMYVWFDALTNYINGLGYADNAETFKKFWEDPASKTIHVIGKGILRFHAVYWPAMLLSAGVRLPSEIAVHGYVTAEGEKMSKSLGNAVSSADIASEWGRDVVRYFLLREISPFEDGDFSRGRLLGRYNADLAHGLGNLVSRSITLMQKNPPTIAANNLHTNIQNTWAAYHNAMENFSFNTALGHVWQLMGTTDKYINDSAPWKIENQEKLRAVLSSVWYSLANISHMLKPFMPDTAEKVVSLLDIPPSGPWENRQPNVQKPAPLFVAKKT